MTIFELLDKVSVLTGIEAELLAITIRQFHGYTEGAKSSTTLYDGEAGNAQWKLLKREITEKDIWNVNGFGTNKAVTVSVSFFDR